MRIAAKLVSFLVLVIVLIVAAEAYLSIGRDVVAFRTELQADAVQFGHTLGVLVQDVWEKRGERRALQLIDEANETETLADIKWVWLDAPPGDPFAPLVSADRQRAAENGSSTLYNERDAAGRAIFCFYEPVDVGSARRGALEIRLPASAFELFRHDTVLSASVVAGCVLFSSVILVIVVGLWMIGRPLRQLTEKTRRIGTGDLSGPLTIRGHDEFAELGVAINEMCDQLASARERLQHETDARISAMEQLQHADRLATVGRLAAGMAHELGTPMNVVSARAASIVEEATSADAAAHANVIRSQIARMTTIIRQLLTFARRQHPRKLPVDVAALIAQSTDLLAAMASKRNVTVRFVSTAKSTLVHGEAGQLQQVLINLLTNAFDAMPHGGTVEVILSDTRARPTGTDHGPPNDYLRIDVKDNGTGIDENDLKRIFDPFFTTKEIGVGTGLGLSITHGIVQDHGGWIDVSSRVGVGSCFSLFLPVFYDRISVPTEAVSSSEAIANANT